MRWKLWLFGLIVLVAAIAGWQVWTSINPVAALKPDSPKAERALQQAVAAQNESAFAQPGSTAATHPQPSALNNVYFGDLHVHTNLSVDAYLFGNRLDVDTAYRVAKGEAATIATGEVVRLTRPLDFAALTDHAEGFASIQACTNAAASESSRAGSTTCQDLLDPSVASFLRIRAVAQSRPPRMDLADFDDDPELARRYASSTWETIKQAADTHYEPGRFTTFAGYEYSPTLPDRGKHHRNVIFRSLNTPDYAVSAFDAASEIDLWQQLSATCTGDCQFLTIPHNPNKSWGLAFASETIDGIPYTTADWRLRAASEPIVEMFQIKGNSECSTAFGAGDEECGFEQFLPACRDGLETSCIYPTSMVRDGLQKGLALQSELGFNPLQFGFIGSTDAHNSNPGDAEEWDYRGSNAYVSSPATRRLEGKRQIELNPGGLAAVWAPENTREALFDAMKRREVYATSGTRIQLRAFAGFDLPGDIAESGDLSAAYANGVPMGGVLDGQNSELALFVWAVQDPDQAPLAKLQVIKGWVENGERRETVVDIACAGSELDATTDRCGDNGATVDLSNCSWSDADEGAELRVRWTDPDFDASEHAFYYVRAVQNPSCRWSTYDSLRLGQAPPTDVPATVTEMAWASPVWVRPARVAEVQ